MVCDLICTRLLLVGLLIPALCDAKWVTMGSSLPTDTVKVGNATVGFSKIEMTYVCRAINSWAGMGASGFTPGNIAHYDKATTQQGYHCVYNMMDTAMCQVYNPQFEVFVDEKKETKWTKKGSDEDNYNARVLGGTFAGDELAICRAKVSGGDWYSGHVYRCARHTDQCCACEPHDNSAQKCQGDFDVLINTSTTTLMI